jgi:MFS family permease
LSAHHDTSSPAAAPERRVGYVELLRRNPTFRNLWLAEVVSLLGDWFTSITLFAMLLEFTGKGEAVGLALVARFLPTLVFGPMAGVAADRYSRRTILITCDLARCLIVLGFLLVRGPGDVWLAYALSFLQLTVSTFFEVAESAAVGSAVTREEIITANAIQGITWSAMLAFGALLGGAVASLVGRTAAFCIDSATFLLSAVFVAKAALPHARRVREEVASWAGTLGLRAAAEGVQYVLRTAGVRSVILIKAGWGVAGGGALMLYSVFGERVFPLGDNAATGIGAIYASRGVGALLGPLVARLAGDDREASLWRAISLSFFGMVVAYLGFAYAPVLGLAALFLCLAHMGVSTCWVFSTALLNLRVPDELKGRAFAADNALCTVAMVVSILATSYGLDHLGISPRTLMAGLAVLLIVPAVGFRVMSAADRLR